MLRAAFYNPGTPQLCKVTDSTRILTGDGPKWKYTLRLIGLEYDESTYSTGDVTAYAPGTLDATTFTAYNVNELENTPTTWFGEASTEFKGLTFEPCPTGQPVLAVTLPWEMVDSSGAYESNSPDFAALFAWPNQLTGDCD